MSLPYETSPLLAAIPGLSHGFFGRRGGNSTGIYASLNMSAVGGDKLTHVANNRSMALDELGFPFNALASVTQVHSSKVVTLHTHPGPGPGPQVDAMVTAVPGIALGILTADCTPILLADPDAAVIGAAHAGWRGAIDGIIANTVAAMVELGAEPARIIAAIGPSISLDNYEVGPQFAADLIARHRDASNRLSIPAAGGREHFDLPGFVFDRLVAAGVGKVNEIARCTYANPKHYFSHRRATHEGTSTGRQMSIIGLV